jgi:adenylate kinase family enzyme
MKDNPKLIIIRGPSGVGKSTVARAVKERSDRPTLLLEQDLFRPLFNKGGTDSDIPIWELIEASVKVGLQHRYDVILEGILNVQKPGRLDFFENLFRYHPEENYLFYLDASFDETLKRHESRPDKKIEFGEKEMREWWDLASKMGHANEVVIPENSTIDETATKIGEIAGLNLVKPA